MINLPIDKIKKTDIDELLISKAAESKTLEYKEELSKDSDNEKKEFLADVSSFANASGGDIIYGIKEERDGKKGKTGRPEAAIGIANITGDEAKLRIENIVRDGLSPRLKFQIKCIDGFPQGPVIILRMPKSLSAPHMILKGSSKFYSRNSAGKYPLDVGEIRSIFLASEALPEKIKRFREQRLAEITADQTPVQLKTGRRFVIHLIPISAFLYGSNNQNIILSSTDDKIRVQQAVSVDNFRYNIDGYLVYQTGDIGDHGRYFQFYRTGIIEYVDSNILTSLESRDNIPGIAYEKRIIERVSNLLNLMKYFNIETPILIMISLLDVKGVKMIHRACETSECIDRDSIILPDILLDDYAVKTEHLLRMVFDAIWQACGVDRSLNYDEHGDWNPPHN